MAGAVAAAAIDLSKFTLLPSPAVPVVARERAWAAGREGELFGLAVTEPAVLGRSTMDGERAASATCWERCTRFSPDRLIAGWASCCARAAATTDCCETLLVDGRSAAATWARAAVSLLVERLTSTLEALTDPSWDWARGWGASTDSTRWPESMAVLAVWRWAVLVACRAAVASVLASWLLVLARLALVAGLRMEVLAWFAWVTFSTVRRVLDAWAA